MSKSPESLIALPLPSGWAWTRVADLGVLGEQTVLTGPFGSNLSRDDFVSDESGAVPVLTIGCLQARGIDRNKAVFVRADKAKEMDRYRLRHGDVMFSRMATVGRAGLIEPDYEGALFNYHLMRLRLEKAIIEPYFFIYFVRGSKAVTDHVRSVNHGMTRDGINTEQLVSMPVAVAPRPEQHRVVAAIDSYFTRLDDAMATLQRAERNLKRYRASVLKSAVEGRLVPTEAALAKQEHRGFEGAVHLLTRFESPPRPNRWNSRSTDIVLGHAALAVGNPGTHLPEGWSWVPLVDVARMESGHTPSRHHPEWWNGDVPWLSIPDARDHHGQTIQDTTQHTNAAGLANSAARILPAGTVSICRTAFSIGHVVVLGRPMATSQDFVNWTPTGAVSPHWLRIVFTVDKEAIRRFGKGSVNKTVYFPEWLSIHIALPPLEEQKRIVTRVDQLLSVVDTVEMSVSHNLRHCGRMRRSILKWAFEGRLVDQDPNDEPASILLMRIKAERETHKTGKPPRKRRADKKKKN